MKKDGLEKDRPSKNSQKKFFLWIHLYDPHLPYHLPESYSREYPAQPYDGEIAFADEQVGRVLRFLKEKGLYRNTVIVLCGDHGESLGEHGEKSHGFFIYNATMHVPLIIRLPGDEAPHKVVDLPVSLVDLMPTILDAVGVDVPAQVQGRSLLAELRDSIAANTMFRRSAIASSMARPTCPAFTSTGANFGVRRTQSIISSMPLDLSSTTCRRIPEKRTIYLPRKRRWPRRCAPSLSA